MGKYDDLRARTKAATQQTQNNIDRYRQAVGEQNATSRDLGSKYNDLRDPEGYRQRQEAEESLRSKVLLRDTLASVMRPVPAAVAVAAASPQSSVKVPQPIAPKRLGADVSAIANKLLLPEAFMPTGGGQVPKTQFDINKQKIENSGAPGAIKTYAEAMNWLTRGNPVGQAVSNAFAGHSGVVQRDPTGNKVVDKASDIINDFVTPFLTPTGAPVGMGPNMGSYEVAGKAMASKPGQAAVNKIAQGIGKMAPRVSPRTAENIARTGLTETVAGPLQGVGMGLTNQQDSNEEIGRNALYGLAGGAVLGFGGAALGASAKSLFNRFLRNKGLSDAEPGIAPLTSTEVSVQSTPAQSTLSLPEGRGPSTAEMRQLRQAAAARRSVLEPGEGTIINPTDWRPEPLGLPAADIQPPTTARRGAKPGLNQILEQMKPIVTERMTPPLENPNELAKWIQYHFGGDVSLNEIRALSYEDMRQLGEEIRKRITVEGTARQVAEDLGYDYDKLLSTRQIDPNLVSKARQTQNVRDTYGLGNVVKSSADRYTPFVGEAAAPETIAGLRPGTRKTRVSGESLDRFQSVPTPSRDEVIAAKSIGQLTQDDIDYLLQDSDRRLAEAGSLENLLANEMTAQRRTLGDIGNMAAPEPLPIGEPILRPGQFDEHSGLGISAFNRTNPYDSLSNDTRSQLVTRQQREPLTGKGSGDRAYTALVDDLHPLNQQDKIMERLMEEPLKASERVHTLGLASRGADVISKRIITDGLVDANGQVVGESLKSILKPLNGLMKQNKHIYVDFEDYLLNKHAITRFDRGEKVFRDDLKWTPEYGAQKVAEYEQQFPEFAEAAEKFYAFNQQMVKSWLVDTGIITEDMAKAWADANPFYVPNKRQFSNLEKVGKSYGRSKQGFGNQSNPVKGYQKGGSQRKIISPIEATIENVDAYVKAAKRNGVMQQYVKNVEAHPEDFADWAEIVKQPEKPEDITKLLLDSNGIDDLLSRFSDDFDKAMQRTKLDKDNIVRVMVGGEPVHVKIKDQQLLSAITAMGPNSAGYMLKLISKITNNMKLLTTGSNPVFSLTRNLFRDIPQAYVASTTRDNPIAFVADLVSAAVDIAGKRGAYKQFLDIGGGHASSIAADRNLLAQSKRAALPQSGVRRAALRGKDAYENFLNSVEIAPRLAEFKRSLDLTGDLQAALAAAQDITVNFKRRGSLSRELDAAFPYWNAAVQGLDKTIRTYKDNPVKAIVKSVIGITIPTLALYALNHDDPNYKKLSNRQKDAFLMVPKGDGTFFKIAKPQEQGSIFSDIPERLMRLFAEQDPAAFRDFADRLRTTFTPPGIQGALKKGGLIDKGLGAAGDTIFGPLADLAANKTFSGAPIVPGYLENLSPELQFDTKTTTISKKLGELTGTSPKQLDYFARQYTGVLGQLGQPLLSPGGDVGSALGQQVTADPVFSNDLSTEFYHYKDKLDQANMDSDMKEPPTWYSDGLRKKMAKISKQMSVIRKDMRAVQDDKSLSNKDKRDELRKLQQSINDMAERGNELAKGQVPY
ncbi:hypothetical protein PaeBR_18655 [Paenibacillus sp. BR2-3]|uniref:LPD38 domain-containing protein n=1 Tax=Paenibacillus sp. BR2-3 TaxID=3048494 RepID=UPI00397758C3